MLLSHSRIKAHTQVLLQCQICHCQHPGEPHLLLSRCQCQHRHHSRHMVSLLSGLSHSRRSRSLSTGTLSLHSHSCLSSPFQHSLVLKAQQAMLTIHKSAKAHLPLLTQLTAQPSSPQLHIQLTTAPAQPCRPCTLRGPIKLHMVIHHALM